MIRTTRTKASILAGTAATLAVILVLAPGARAAEAPAAKPAAPVATPTLTPVTPAAPAAAPKPTGPQPKLVIDNITFDAKDVPKGDVIQHDFNVKNEGKSDLMILNVQPSCGCTAPDWTKIVPPGGSGKITLKIDTAKFKGPISKTANVTTNDPDQASFRLTVNAQVKTFVDLLPSDRISLRQYRGESKDQTITIHSNESGEFKINDAQVTGDGIKHELKKSTDGTGEYSLRVWLDKTAPIGSINGSVKLLTSSTKEPEINVPVVATVLGQLTVNPSTIFFRVDGGTKTWQPTTDNLNLRATGDAKGEVVTKLAKDSKLTLVETIGEWSHVKTSTDPAQEGWVSTKMITESAAGSAPAVEPKVLSVTHRDEKASFQVTGSTVEGAKIDPKALKVVTEPVKENQSYRVTVTYGGKLDKGNYNGTLILKTTDKDEPEIRVPIYIVVA